MRTIIKSIYKNPLKNAAYVVLLITAFTFISLIFNAYFYGLRILLYITEFRQPFTDFDFYCNHSNLYDIQNAIRSVMSSLFGMVAFAVLLCVLLLPFFQYMLSLGHGYEIGVFRALGLSKVKVWVRLFIENILLTGAALMLALCAALFFYRQFAFALLGVDAETEQLLLGYFGDIFGFVWQAYLYTVYMAVAVTLISSAFINVLISNNTPLKLLLSYK